jgi:polyhydroxybutyrate depolymerase
MFRPAQWLIAVLAMVAIGACGKVGEPWDPTMQRHTMEHGGQLREYFVFLPSTYDGERALPAAIFLHGYGGTATGTEAEVTQGLNQYAEEYGYVMVYPQGTWFMSSVDGSDAWEVTSWNHISDGFDTGPDGPTCTEDAYRVPCPPECGSCGQCGWTSCNDDVGFLRALVGVVTTTFAVDAQRVYVSGFSNGAMMTNRIACEASELFAAAALIGGRLERGFECTPAQPVPLLQVNGGADDTVPNDGRVSSGGYFFAATESVEQQWNEGAECANAPERWSSPTIEDKDVQCTIACSDTQSPTIDCVWPDGDHRWPGTAGVRGSNGYCVTELQAASMPDQTICIAPEKQTDIWGSRLLFEFFNQNPGEQQ